MAYLDTIWNAYNYRANDVTQVSGSNLRRQMVDDWWFYRTPFPTAMNIFCIFQTENDFVAWTANFCYVHNIAGHTITLLVQSNLPLTVRYGIADDGYNYDVRDNFLTQLDSDQLGIGFYSLEYTVPYDSWTQLSTDPRCFNNFSTAIDRLSHRTKAIKYNLVNCTAPGAPLNATPGNTVSVPLRFPTGFSVVNPESDVIVRNNGIRVNANYSTDQTNTGTVSFIMP